MEKVETRSAVETMQILRWGTPGWTLFVAFIMFVFIDALVSDSILFVRIIDLIKSPGAFGAAALVVGSGVPVGFVLYQIYFFFRWLSPTENFFVGNIIVESLEGVEEKEQKVLLESCITKKKPIIGDYRWYILENFLLFLASIDETSKTMYNRSRYLLDLLHTLGTATFAIILGWVFYLIVKKSLQQLDIASVIITLVVAIPLIIIFIANYINVQSQIIYLHNYLLRKHIEDKITSFCPKL